jgi:hypothetical protein
MVIMIRELVGMGATTVGIMVFIMMDIVKTGIMTGIVVIGIGGIETTVIETGETMIVKVEIVMIIGTRVSETVIRITVIETIRLEILEMAFGDNRV